MKNGFWASAETGCRFRLSSVRVKRVSMEPQVLAQHDVAAGSPHALTVSCGLDQSATASSVGMSAAICVRHQRIVVKFDVVQVVRGLAGLDDMHVDVLRHLAPGIEAGTNRIEAVATGIVAASPCAQFPAPGGSARIDALGIRLIGLDDDAGNRRSSCIAHASLVSQRLSGHTRRSNRCSRCELRGQADKDVFACFARQSYDVLRRWRARHAEGEQCGDHRKATLGEETMLPEEQAFASGECAAAMQDAVQGNLRAGWGEAKSRHRSWDRC